MKQVIIYGAGKLGEQILFHLLKQKIKIAGFADDTKEVGFILGNGHKVIGGFDFVVDHKDTYKVVLAIGYDHLKAKNNLLQKLKEKGVTLLNFIHPNACIESPEKLGVGNFIMAGAVIDQNVTLGDGNYIDIGVKIGEFSQIRDGNYFSNGSLVGGYVAIGSENFFGMGSIVVNDINIGYTNKVNAGSLIYKDLDNSKLVVEVRTQKTF